MSGPAPDPRTFNKDVSAPVEELVTLSQAVSNIQVPPPENEHNSNRDVNSTQSSGGSVQGSGSVNLNTTVIVPPQLSETRPEIDLDSDSESSASEYRPLVQERYVPIHRRIAQAYASMTKRKRLKIAMTLIILSMVITISFETGFGVHYGLKPPSETIGEYTRTGTNALLATFPCTRTSCDISKVNIELLSPTRPDQIDYFLTDCSNVIYGDLEAHNNYVSRLDDANIPEPIVTEDYLMKNYFTGQLSILMHARPLSFQDEIQHKSEVYLCHFVDPVKFDQFLQSGNHWRDYIETAICKVLEIDSVASARNYSVKFDIKLPSFSFVGAVLTTKSYMIQFGYNVVGREIVHINDTKKCSLNFNGNTHPLHCSVSVNSSLATNSQMCVLGRGVSENDGRYQYTRAAVSLNYISQTKFMITMIVCSIIIILIILFSVKVYYWYKCCTTQRSTQDSEAVEGGSYEDIIKGQHHS